MEEILNFENASETIPGKEIFFLVKGYGHTSKGYPSPADSPLQ